LPGFYDEWVSIERDRLNALFEAKIARLLEILLAEGRWTEVLDWGNRWIALGQWPEPAYRALMTGYANSGDISRAVSTYDRFAQGFHKEMGLKPSEQTQVLYKRLKNGWKQDIKSQSTYQTMKTPIPVIENPVIASPSSAVRLSNLPKPLTSFIGREKEIQQVEQLVTGARLVTIMGTGGVGKTRLAIQIADSLALNFKDGVWWIELASLMNQLNE
jgi:hypothetical protein